VSPTTHRELYPPAYKVNLAHAGQSWLHGIDAPASKLPLGTAGGARAADVDEGGGQGVVIASEEGLDEELEFTAAAAPALEAGGAAPAAPAAAAAIVGMSHQAAEDKVREGAGSYRQGTCELLRLGVGKKEGWMWHQFISVDGMHTIGGCVKDIVANLVGSKWELNAQGGCKPKEQEEVAEQRAIDNGGVRRFTQAQLSGVSSLAALWASAPVCVRKVYIACT